LEAIKFYPWHGRAFLLLSFAYTRFGLSLSCRVSCTDSEGPEHAVDVAASAFEAAVLVLAEFRW
jgi:hypothetical protein